eukprot:jgi/Bigna1/140364/aug1.55_g15072
MDVVTLALDAKRLDGHLQRLLSHEVFDPSAMNLISDALLRLKGNPEDNLSRTQQLFLQMVLRILAKMNIRLDEVLRTISIDRYLALLHQMQHLSGKGKLSLPLQENLYCHILRRISGRCFRVDSLEDTLSRQILGIPQELEVISVKFAQASYAKGLKGDEGAKKRRIRLLMECGIVYCTHYRYDEAMKYFKISEALGAQDEDLKTINGFRFVCESVGKGKNSKPKQDVDDNGGDVNVNPFETAISKTAGSKKRKRPPQSNGLTTSSSSTQTKVITKKQAAFHPLDERACEGILQSFQYLETVGGSRGYGDRGRVLTAVSSVYSRAIGEELNGPKSKPIPPPSFRTVLKRNGISGAGTEMTLQTWQRVMNELEANEHKLIPLPSVCESVAFLLSAAKHIKRKEGSCAAEEKGMVQQCFEDLFRRTQRYGGDGDRGVERSMTMYGEWALRLCKGIAVLVTNTKEACSWSSLRDDAKSDLNSLALLLLSEPKLGLYISSRRRGNEWCPEFLISFLRHNREVYEYLIEFVSALLARVQDRIRPELDFPISVFRSEWSSMHARRQIQARDILAKVQVPRRCCSADALRNLFRVLGTLCSFRRVDKEAVETASSAHVRGAWVGSTAYTYDLLTCSMVEACNARPEASLSYFGSAVLHWFSMRNPMAAATESKGACLPDFILDERLLITIVTCLMSLSENLYAAIICQFFDPPLRTFAEKALKRKSSKDLDSSLYQHIFDMPLLESLVVLHSSRGNAAQREIAIRSVQNPLLNLHNELSLRDAHIVQMKLEFIEKFAEAMQKKYTTF